MPGHGPPRPPALPADPSRSHWGATTDRPDTATGPEEGTEPTVRGRRSASARETLARDGHVHLPGFLDAEEVARCREVFDEAARRLDRPLGDEWFPTILLQDDEVRALITDGPGAR